MIKRLIDLILDIFPIYLDARPTRRMIRRLCLAIQWLIGKRVCVYSFKRDEAVPAHLRV